MFGWLSPETTSQRKRHSSSSFQEDTEESKENGSAPLRSVQGKENSSLKENSFSSRESSKLKALTAELQAAKNDAKAAAEIGQELLKQDRIKSEEIESLKETINEQLVEIGSLQDQLNSLQSENGKTLELLEESRAECELLLQRNLQLSQKLETVNREAVQSCANLAEYEEKFETVTMERDKNAEKVMELQAQVVKLKAQVEASERNGRSSTGGMSTSSLSSPTGKQRLLKKASSYRSYMEDTLHDSDSDSDSGDSLLSETPKASARLRDQLSVARLQNAESQRRILALESALEENTLERQRSVRKLQSLERNLNEYQEIIQAQSELTSCYKDQLEEADDEDEEHGSTLESILLEQELGKLRQQTQNAEILAALKSEELETVINQLLELEERLLQERGQNATLRRRRMNRKMYAACDVGVGTEEDMVPQLIDLREPEEIEAVQRNGYSGPLLVKFGKKSRFGMGSQRWKARMVELRGPHLLFFRNEWDTKPSKVVPIDGTEVRVVRRPHREEALDGSFADRDFKLDPHSLTKKKKRRSLKAAVSQRKTARGGIAGRSRSFTSIFLPDSQAQQEANMDRAGRVVHEFHLWHPRRPVVYFSAPTHDEMSNWAEQIQKQSTSVAVRPRRFAAGYLTIMSDYSGDNSHHLKRFFAVLRTDGIHLYTHPRKRNSVRVILLDSHARVWKPEAKRKASLLFEDLGRTFCVKTSEQGRSTLVADTDVDCEWWVNTLKAHGMGVVSWGSVTGMRDNEPFGCLNI